MAIAWDHVRTIGSVLSILGVGAGVALYFSDFKTRLEKSEVRIVMLEDQMKLLSAAPAIVRRESGGNLYTKEGGTYFDDVPVANPLIATCIDLMKRTAAAKEKKDFA